METASLTNTDLDLTESTGDLAQPDTTDSTATNREEFSSEKYKIEVKNLPNIFGYGSLRKFFGGLNLKFVKITAPQASNFAFLTFASEEAKEEAIKLINTTTYKGKLLEAVVNVRYESIVL